MNGRRVVITGTGTVNPLANSTSGTWEAIVARASGIGPITRFDASHLPVRIAGEVRDLDPAQHYDGEMAKSSKRMDEFCHYAAAAAGEATRQAGLETIAERNRI